jgi:hypothetical protein
MATMNRRGMGESSLGQRSRECRKHSLRCATESGPALTSAVSRGSSFATCHEAVMIPTSRNHALCGVF